MFYYEVYKAVQEKKRLIFKNRIKTLKEKLIVANRSEGGGIKLKFLGI